MTITTTPTSEVLNRAADLIEERGWTHGEGWQYADYRPVSLCLEGAIQAATGHVFTDFAHNYDGSAESEALIACPAYAAVQAHLAINGDLWRWNDREGTAERVIEVLRACAVIEASRERETAEMLVSA